MTKGGFAGWEALNGGMGGECWKGDGEGARKGR